MKELRCLSLDYSTASTAERDAAKGMWTALPGLKERGIILEAVPVATCNRTELYLRLPPGGTVPKALADPQARVFSGEEAVLHLLRVLLGLESMACGESSIVGQIRDSYGGAADLCGPLAPQDVRGSLSHGEAPENLLSPRKRTVGPMAHGGKAENP